MIKSMTGFARGEISNENIALKAELKCVNSKFCDIQVRLPRLLSFMEVPLRGILSAGLVRGKAELSVDARFFKPGELPRLNREQFSAALGILEQMKEGAGLDEALRLEHFLGFEGMVSYESTDELKATGLLIEKLTADCLTSLDKMRISEGKNLEIQISALLDTLGGLTIRIDELKEGIQEHWLARFKARVKDFAGEELDEGRLIQEAAIYAEKADIREEIARINSHLAQFRVIMAEEYPCGKKLDFLCQELYRECNTIASKSTKTEMISTVVEAKSAVDSIREQIQNVV